MFRELHIIQSSQSNDFSNVHIFVIICLSTSEDYMLLEGSIHEYSSWVL